MTKYKRFMAAVRHLQDYRRQNTRPTVEASINERPRAERDGGIDAARGISGNVEGAISERNITLAAVRRALADLPEHQRRILILICVGGISYEKAANVLDVPSDVIASQMARARKALAEQIASNSDTAADRTKMPPVAAWSGTPSGDD
jgi:DNA-directed RNA polymerase specialized sigma24 family protein